MNQILSWIGVALVATGTLWLLASSLRPAFRRRPNRGRCVTLLVLGTMFLWGMSLGAIKALVLAVLIWRSEGLVRHLLSTWESTQLAHYHHPHPAVGASQTAGADTTDADTAGADTTDADTAGADTTDADTALTEGLTPDHAHHEKEER